MDNLMLGLWIISAAFILMSFLYVFTRDKYDRMKECKHEYTHYRECEGCGYRQREVKK